MSAFTPTIGTTAPSVNTPEDVLVLEQAADAAPKKAKKVKPYHSMRVHVPRSGYTLNNVGFYRLVALYRLRRNKKNDVFLSEVELMKACKVDRASRLDSLVWEPLAAFIVSKTRTYQGGVPCWRVILVDPNVKPDNWREGHGKWFLRVPCWWLWACETAHKGDKWVDAQHWNYKGAALKAAVAPQIADETRGKGQTDGKNTAYYAKVLGIAPKSASEALTTATDLGWIGSGNRSGGKGVKASRWTRWHTNDPTGDTNPRWAAGHQGRLHAPAATSVTPDLVVVTAAPESASSQSVDVAVNPNDPWGLGIPLSAYPQAAPEQTVTTEFPTEQLVSAAAAEYPW